MKKKGMNEKGRNSGRCRKKRNESLTLWKRRELMWCMSSGEKVWKLNKKGMNEKGGNSGRCRKERNESPTLWKRRELIWCMSFGEKVWKVDKKVMEKEGEKGREKCKCREWKAKLERTYILEGTKVYVVYVSWK